MSVGNQTNRVISSDNTAADGCVSVCALMGKSA